MKLVFSRKMSGGVSIIPMRLRKLVHLGFIRLCWDVPIMNGIVMSGANQQISGDAPGTVAAYVEQKASAPVLYINGAAGNMAPIYSGYPNPRSGHLSQFNVLLGDRILTGLKALGSPSSDV